MNENVSLLARLTADQNGDGTLTISEIGPWLLEFLLLPGDAAILLMLRYVPALAGFFELGTDDLGGTFSIVTSIVLWLACVVAVGAFVNALRAMDRTLTAWLAARYAESVRLIRVLVRRVRVTLTRLLARTRTSDGDLVVTDVSLNNIETAVLRCLTQMEDGAVMTIDELAARFRCPPRSMRTVVGRLADLAFIESAGDRLTGAKGHRIATAGQMFLLGA